MASTVISMRRRRFSIDTATSGDTTIAAAVSGLVYVPVGMALVGNGTVTVQITDGASGTVLMGPFRLTSTNPAVVIPVDFGAGGRGTANTALILNLNAAVQVGGHLIYDEDR